MAAEAPHLERLEHEPHRPLDAPPARRRAASSWRSPSRWSPSSPRSSARPPPVPTRRPSPAAPARSCRTRSKAATSRCPTTYGVEFRPGVMIPGARIYRTPGVGGNQIVSYIVQIQKWNGIAWVVDRGSPAAPSSRRRRRSSTQRPSTRRSSPAYHTVNIAVGWRGADVDGPDERQPPTTSASTHRPSAGLAGCTCTPPDRRRLGRQASRGRGRPSRGRPRLARGYPSVPGPGAHPSGRATGRLSPFGSS